MLWLLMRAVKYRFFGSGTVGRYLWYSYYIPLILCRCSVLCRAGRGASGRGKGCRTHGTLLLIPAGLLIAGVLSNDASAGVSLCAVSGKRKLYPRRTVYAGDDLGRRMDDGGCGGMILTCRVSENRKKAWIPVCVFAGGWMLCGASFMDINPLHEVPECFCLMFAALWESCIQTGLLPTNADYRGLFSESTLAAQIGGRTGADAVPRQGRADPRRSR